MPSLLTLLDDATWTPDDAAFQYALRVVGILRPDSQAVLLDENRFSTGSRAWKLAVSILTHAVVLTTPILIGLFFTDTINIKQYAAAMLVALPPPPPPPPPATTAIIKADPSRARFISAAHHANKARA